MEVWPTWQSEQTSTYQAYICWWYKAECWKNVVSSPSSPINGWWQVLAVLFAAEGHCRSSVWLLDMSWCCRAKFRITCIYTWNCFLTNSWNQSNIICFTTQSACLCLGLCAHAGAWDMSRSTTTLHDLCVLWITINMLAKHWLSVIKWVWHISLQVTVCLCSMMSLYYWNNVCSGYATNIVLVKDAWKITGGRSHTVFITFRTNCENLCAELTAPWEFTSVHFVLLQRTSCIGKGAVASFQTFSDAISFYFSMYWDRVLTHINQ